MATARCATAGSVITGGSERCVDTPLGMWLARTGAGAGFHPGLVFGGGEGHEEDPASRSRRHMGRAIYADRIIRQEEVLASCAVHAVISRQTSLERITALIRRLQDGRVESQDMGVTGGKPSDQILGPGEASVLTQFLDRTVISLYLLLTQIALRSHSEQGRSCEADHQSDIYPLLDELFSFHHEYVRLLPRTEDLLTPLFWTETELDTLGPFSLLHAVDQQKTLWTGEYASLLLHLQDLSPALHRLVARHASCQDYFWASTIVTSRSFPSTLLANTSHASGPPGDHDANQPTLRASETVPILLPGVDIFNHKRGSKIEWRSVRNQPDTHRIEIVSLEEQIPKGDQVFNNYGAKSTAELILGYGFVLDEQDWEAGGRANPDDVYSIKLTRPPPDQEQTYSQFVGEVFGRFSADELTHYVRSATTTGQDHHRIPALLLAQLRVSVVSSDQDVEILQQRLQHPLSHASSSSPGTFAARFLHVMQDKISWQNELDCLDCLRALVEHKLGTARAALLHRRGDGEWERVRASVRRMIEVYQQGQLQILEDTLTFIERCLDDTLEKAVDDGFQVPDEEEEEGY